jgi:hypothetical protein
MILTREFCDSQPTCTVVVTYPDGLVHAFADVMEGPHGYFAGVTRAAMQFRPGSKREVDAHLDGIRQSYVRAGRAF